MSLAIEGPQPYIDDVVDHMAAVCNAPIAVVTLSEGRRQWINAVAGGKGGEVNPETTFDALRLMGEVSSVVSDSATCEGFDASSLDAAQSGIRSFLGEPLVHGGEAIGHVYLADVVPREWSPKEMAYLQRFARLIVAQVEARSLAAEPERTAELERELAQMGALYRTVVEHMTEGVVLVSAEGVIEAANEVACEILGASSEAIRGKTPTDPDWRPVQEDGAPLDPNNNPVVLAMTTGDPQLGVVAGIDRPGGRRWLEINSVPVEKRTSGGRWRVATTFRDITEKRRQEQMLVEAREAAERTALSRQQFLADMSHEIRTPLNGVVGLAQALRMTKLDAEQQDLVDTILESSGTLNAILNDALDLSKIEAGKFELAPSMHDVGEFFRRLIQLWKPTAREKGLELDLALDSGVPGGLRFDGVRVQQCLNNLVSNAVKFTSEGGVKLAAEARSLPDGDLMVTVSVTDSGLGMDDLTLARLFQPFTQANELVATQHGGTGLGLSITRKLADLMGGEVGARSEIGKGSTFHFSFRASPPVGASRPVIDNHEPAIAEEDVLSSEPEPMRVLVVDDNPVNRRVVILFLKPLGATIVEAENGAEALEAMEAERFDIVLLDMHMPVLDGPGAIARIRASEEDWSQTPVIAVTADAMNGAEERFLAMGLDAYVPKPVNAQMLLSEIQRLTGAGMDDDLRAAG